MIRDLENRFWLWLQSSYPFLHGIAFEKRRVFRYILSGGTAAFVNIGLLYIFTDVFGIWYLFSATLSFLVAFVVSFGFQKFWTFEDHSTDGLHGQAILYLFVALVNLCLNTAFVYMLVEFVHVHYVLAQIISGVVIACESFFVYRKFIFR